MSKLQELIRELCPDGVEYKTIKESVGLNRGRRLTKNELLDDGMYEVYHGSKDTPLGLYNQYNAPRNTTIVVNTGGIGGVKFLENEFWCSDGSFWLGQSDDIKPKYLYYCLSGYEKYFASKKRIGGVPTIDRSVIEDFLIPVPPLEVQEEIVRILDNFTNLAAELQAELQARQEQYEYYRDKLLSFNNIDGGCATVTWMKMSEICEIKRGVRVTRNSLVTDGLFFVFQNSLTPLGNFDKYNRDGNKTFVICAGAAGEIGYSNKPFWAADDCFTIETDKVDNKYIYHFLLTKKTLLKSRVRKASVPRISAVEIGKLIIPIPSWEEQLRIVAILDKFDALVNDLSRGLPAEIAAVQEQYEYYRDKLLSFPRNKISA